MVALGVELMLHEKHDSAPVDQSLFGYCLYIKRRLSRCKQLRGLVPVVRLGVPLRCKAGKLVDNGPVVLNVCSSKTALHRISLDPCVALGSG